MVYVNENNFLGWTTAHYFDIDVAFTRVQLTKLHCEIASGQRKPSLQWLMKARKHYRENTQRARQWQMTGCHVKTMQVRATVSITELSNCLKTIVNCVDSLSEDDQLPTVR